MKQNKNPFLLASFLGAILFTSCNTGSKFASSFGKRKYMKGIYVDVPSTINTHINNSPVPYKVANSNAPIVTPIPHITENNIIKPSSTIKRNPAPSILRISSSSKPIVLIPVRPNTERINKQDTATGGDVDNSGDVNYFAIAGLAFSIAGVVITAIDGFMPILAIVFISLAAILCVYSLFLNKIYWTWLAILGLCVLIIFFTLLFL